MDKKRQKPLNNIYFKSFAIMCMSSEILTAYCSCEALVNFRGFFENFIISSKTSRIYT